MTTKLKAFHMMKGNFLLEEDVEQLDLIIFIRKAGNKIQIYRSSAMTGT